ncbi:MAG: DUF4116 domain-containing protein [bacterium]
MLSFIIKMEILDKYIEYLDITYDEFLKENPNYLYYFNDIKNIVFILKNIKYIKKECVYNIYKKAIKQNSYNLQYVVSQTPEICMAAVKQNGWALQYVDSQTPEICMAAVKNYGLALQYVDSQTPEICMAAVKENGEALYCVKEQTPEICMAAVKQNGWALQYVKEQTPEISMAAVKQNGLVTILKNQNVSNTLDNVTKDKSFINSMIDIIKKYIEVKK